MRLIPNAHRSIGTSLSSSASTTSHRAHSCQQHNVACSVHVAHALHVRVGAPTPTLSPHSPPEVAGSAAGLLLAPRPRRRSCGAQLADGRAQVPVGLSPRALLPRPRQDVPVAARRALLGRRGARRADPAAPALDLLHVCVCARVRVRVCACVCVRVCVRAHAYVRSPCAAPFRLQRCAVFFAFRCDCIAKAERTTGPGGQLNKFIHDWQLGPIFELLIAGTPCNRSPRTLSAHTRTAHRMA